MMKILGLSDLHTDGGIPKKALQKMIDQEYIDTIILAGDLTTFGSSRLVKKVLQEFSTFDVKTLYIPGNMDAPDSGDFEFSNLSPLHARAKSISGITFIGLGASNPTPFNTPNTLTEEELNVLLERAIKEWKGDEPLFLVSHSPPLNSEADIVSKGTHVGSSAVREFIDKKNPLAVLCGHIHEARSISKINETICINPGPAKFKCGAILEVNNINNNWEVSTRLISF